MFEEIFFYGLGVVAVASAILTVTRRNPVVSALYLILNFLCLAGLYLTLNAQFIAIIQIIVYAGAIMVLFLFVIMLLNLGDDRKLTEEISLRKLVGAGMLFALLMEVIYIISIIAAGNNIWPLWTVAVAFAVAVSMFMIPFHADFSNVENVKHIGRQLSTMTILEKVAGALGPLAGGLIAAKYGFEVAVITSVAVLFSYRTILLYLWGQRHNVTAFVFLPLAMYALYKYSYAPSKSFLT